MTEVLVFGGTGLVGKHLQKVKPNWKFCGSKGGDLRSIDSVITLLDLYKPTAVINLAGKVGGIKSNSEKQGEFFYDNVSIGVNVIEACREAGISRLLTALSTCAFPDEVIRYPMTEEDLHIGPPTITNFSYGYAKRVIQVMTNSYREQYGLNYSCFSPSNIYGPEDNFDLDTAHFVPACIRKFHNNNDNVELWGTGSPRRQQLYVGDLAVAIPIILDKHSGPQPLIVAPNENLSVSGMAAIIKKVTNSKASIKFNGSFEGQLRKDGSNRLFRLLTPEFKFTPFEEGIKRTYKWYKEQ